jgi:hypothetical protein
VPRPISWLPRLHQIRRGVKHSVRSHFERRDIERLFQLQPRAAQLLIEGISPAAKVGRSFLLARVDLENFLGLQKGRFYEMQRNRILIFSFGGGLLVLKFDRAVTVASRCTTVGAMAGSDKANASEC